MSFFSFQRILVIDGKEYFIKKNFLINSFYNNIFQIDEDKILACYDKYLSIIYLNEKNSDNKLNSNSNNKKENQKIQQKKYIRKDYDCKLLDYSYDYKCDKNNN